MDNKIIALINILRAKFPLIFAYFCGKMDTYLSLGI